MPDDTLLDLAAREPAPRSRRCSRRRCAACWPTRSADALVENFAGQWLHIRNLQNIAPNTDEFPDFDNDLRDAFRRETELFFGSIMREDRNVLDLLTADYTFVNERLAQALRHARRLRQPVPPRHADRRRAARAARQGQHPDGDVARRPHRRRCCAASGFWRTCSARRRRRRRPTCRRSSRPPAPTPRTIRERWRAIAPTRRAPSCHRLMDPLGFALENFNAVGAWRDARGRRRRRRRRARMADGQTAVGRRRAARGAARRVRTCSSRR